MLATEKDEEMREMAKMELPATEEKKDKMYSSIQYGTF